MKFTAQISSLALGAVLAFSGAAYAQTMVAGMSVSADDLVKVQAQCDALALKMNTNGTTATTDTSKTSETDSGDKPGDVDAVEVNGMDQATTTIDLAILTYENCKEAGLVE